jgi:hypothetical protein
MRTISLLLPHNVDRVSKSVCSVVAVAVRFSWPRFFCILDCLCSLISYLCFTRTHSMALWHAGARSLRAGACMLLPQGATATANPATGLGGRSCCMPCMSVSAIDFEPVIVPVIVPRELSHLYLPHQHRQLQCYAPAADHA